MAKLLEGTPSPPPPPDPRRIDQLRAEIKWLKQELDKSSESRRALQEARQAREAEARELRRGLEKAMSESTQWRHRYEQSALRLFVP